MSSSSHENQFTAIESDIRNARPTVDIETQIRIAYAAGSRAGGRDLVPRYSNTKWKVVSLALAGCVLFLLLPSTWFIGENTTGPDNGSMAQQDEQMGHSNPVIELKNDRGSRLRIADWRVYSDAEMPPSTSLPNGSATEFGPSLRPTSVNQLIDSI